MYRYHFISFWFFWSSFKLIFLQVHSIPATVCSSEQGNLCYWIFHADLWTKLILDLAQQCGLIRYNHLFVSFWVLDSYSYGVTILGGLNHRQRRIQLQGKLFMVYFMKTLPSMYYLSFGCCFFSLQCRARRFSIDVQTLHLPWRRGCIFLHYLHWFNMIFVTWHYVIDLCLMQIRPAWLESTTSMLG